MKSPKFPIRWKLLAGFVGLTLLVLLVVLFTVSRILDNRIRDEINSNFQEAGKIFEQLQEIRFRQLRQTATLVADMPYLKAAISTGDENTVNNHIRQELVSLLHFDPLISDTLSADLLTTSVDSVGLVMVFDAEGEVLGELSDPERSDRSAEQRTGLEEALGGQFPRRSHIWKKGNNYFNVITIPIVIGGQVGGALSLGYPIRNQEVELLADVIEYEVSYYVDDQVLATSLNPMLDDMRTELREGIRSASLEEIFEKGGTTIRLNMNNSTWLVYVLPMIGSRQIESGMTGYYTVAKSLTEALEPLYQLQRVIYIIGFGGILLAVLLGITLTNNLTRPINLLYDGIRRIENEEYDTEVEVVSRDEFGQLTRTFNNLVANVKENIREKEVLLAEIHHRVKNNLAVISGLLELEADNVEDEDTMTALQNSRMRIHSMATIHELMYEAQNFHRLSFGNFISKMVTSIKEVYGSDNNGIEIDLDVEDVRLNINQAVPCGLVINELVTNALKHAYPEEKSGVIYVSLKEQGGQIVLNVKDEGVGLPEDSSTKDHESLGFTLVNILCKQLEAELSFESDGGTTVTVEFEKSNDQNDGTWISHP